MPRDLNDDRRFGEIDGHVRDFGHEERVYKRVDLKGAEAAFPLILRRLAVDHYSLHPQRK